MEVHLPRPGRTGARAAVDELAASFAATLGGLSTEQMTCQMRRLVTRARKIVLQVAAIVWVVAMLAQFELDSRYVYYPRVVNPEIGRTEPYAVKGIVVYVTRDQLAFLEWLRWLEIGSGALGLISLILHQIWPIKPND